MRKFWDVETDEVLTIEELRALYEKGLELTESETFEEFLAGCLEGNGTLVEVV